MAEIVFRAWSIAHIAAIVCDRTLHGFCRSLLLISAPLLATRLIPVTQPMRLRSQPAPSRPQAPGGF